MFPTPTYSLHYNFHYVYIDVSYSYVFPTYCLHYNFHYVYDG